MARGFDININGLDKLRNRVKKLNTALKTEVVKEVHTAGLNIANGARSRVPVNFGGLKSKINNDDTETGTEVIVQQSYAAYVEFGTGAEVEVPAGLEDYALQFFVSGKGHLPAQPFLFPAYFEERNKMIQRIKQVLNKP